MSSQDYVTTIHTQPSLCVVIFFSHTCLQLKQASKYKYKYKSKDHWTESFIGRFLVYIYIYMYIYIYIHVPIYIPNISSCS